MYVDLGYNEKEYTPPKEFCSKKIKNVIHASCKLTNGIQNNESPFVSLHRIVQNCSESWVSGMAARAFLKTFQMASHEALHSIGSWALHLPRQSCMHDGEWALWSNWIHIVEKIHRKTSLNLHYGENCGYGSKPKSKYQLCYSVHEVSSWSTDKQTNSLSSTNIISLEVRNLVSMKAGPLLWPYQQRANCSFLLPPYE